MVKFTLIFFVTIFHLFGEEKVLLISGATQGVGLATARLFHENGWIVWAGFRKNIPQELVKMENINLCYLDVTDDSSIDLTVNQIYSTHGKIDVLINNAGHGLIGAEECVTIQEVEQLFNTNFLGPLRLIQHVLPIMRLQNAGHIINISSCLGVRSLPGLGLYSASKFALEGLSESLAATVAPWNIKVTIVEPGPINNSWATSCRIGSRECSEAFYQDLQKSMNKMLSSVQTQQSEEVAELLFKIVNDPKPRLRYQTSPSITNWVSKQLVDPTGISIHRENIDLIKQMINEE